MGCLTQNCTVHSPTVDHGDSSIVGSSDALRYHCILLAIDVSTQHPSADARRMALGLGRVRPISRTAVDERHINSRS